MRSVPFPHPGEILKEEFLRPLSMEPEHLARRINVPLAHLEGITTGRDFITNAVAHKLAEHFATTASFWLNLQRGYDKALQLQRQALPIAAIPPHR